MIYDGPPMHATNANRVAASNTSVRACVHSNAGMIHKVATVACCFRVHTLLVDSWPHGRVCEDVALLLQGVRLPLPRALQPRRPCNDDHAGTPCPSSHTPIPAAAWDHSAVWSGAALRTTCCMLFGCVLHAVWLRVACFVLHAARSIRRRPSRPSSARRWCKHAQQERLEQPSRCASHTTPSPLARWPKLHTASSRRPVPACSKPLTSLCMHGRASCSRTRCPHAQRGATQQHCCLGPKAHADPHVDAAVGQQAEQRRRISEARCRCHACCRFHHRCRCHACCRCRSRFDVSWWRCFVSGSGLTRLPMRTKLGQAAYRPSFRHVLACATPLYPACPCPARPPARPTGANARHGARGSHIGP